MSASAEGYVYIDSARLNIQPVNALLEEHWYVVCFCCLYHISLFITHMYIFNVKSGSKVHKIPHIHSILTYKFY